MLAVEQLSQFFALNVGDDLVHEENALIPDLLLVFPV